MEPHFEVVMQNFSTQAFSAKTHMGIFQTSEETQLKYVDTTEKCCVLQFIVDCFQHNVPHLCQKRSFGCWILQRMYTVLFAQKCSIQPVQVASKYLWEDGTQAQALHSHRQVGCICYRKGWRCLWNEARLTTAGTRKRRPLSPDKAAGGGMDGQLFSDQISRLFLMP